MVEEKKTRQRLTMTAMYNALNDLFFATLPDDQRSTHSMCFLSTGAKKQGDDIVYFANLMSSQDKPGTITVAAAIESKEGVDEAVAALLGFMKDRFEEKRKILLGEYDSVLARHDGALRGARSKIREKKT